jgi:hypothetical protein
MNTNNSKSFVQSAKDPILINTHHTQYYGRVLNNNYHYKKVQLTSEIVCADFAHEKLYVIYDD